jgi:hypothetical protein
MDGSSRRSTEVDGGRGPSVLKMLVCNGVSLALTALLFLVLGLAAGCVAPRPGQGLAGLCHRRPPRHGEPRSLRARGEWNAGGSFGPLHSGRDGSVARLARHENSPALGGGAPGQSPLPREVPAWPAIQNSDLLDVGEVPGSGAWRRGRRSLHLGAARPSRGAGACRRLGAARGQGETGSRRSGAPLRPSPRSALPQHRTLMTERRPSATPSSFPSPAPAEEARAWSPLPG